MKDHTIANDSGSTRSVWMSEHVPSFDAEIAEGDEPEVCVIGAGIAGLSVALALVEEGRDVLVVDRGAIGGGQTARTSAHLASAVDDRFHKLERRFGRDGAKLVYESHAAAIDMIERNATEYDIACDLQRVDGYLWGEAHEELAVELEACRRAGLPVEPATHAPLPFATGPCLRFADQAELHPLRYLRGLAAAIRAGGGRIHTGVQVEGIEGGEPVELHLAGGRTLRARSVVDATQMAIASRFDIPLREASYRSYVVALDCVRGYVPHALYWDTLDPYHYIRVARGKDGRDVVLVGGEDHRVGQGDPDAALAALTAWAREHFPQAGGIVGRWSGQIQEPHDGLAYIGALPHHDHVYVVTGDSGNGLTHGTIAAAIVPALIAGREHPWAALYDPGRTRLHAIGHMVKELARSNGPYVDWLRGADVQSLDNIAPGEGATIRRGLHVIAAYKDERGQCHLRNARCPHLHGVVRWNHAEKTWDCPVHGSRFDGEGHVLNGPSSVDLAAAPVDIEQPAITGPSPQPSLPGAGTRRT